MAERPRVFLDTSALIAGILSRTGGARAILLQGEYGLIELRVSRYVLAELEEVMRRKLPDRLDDVALLLDAARVKIGRDPDAAQLAHLINRRQ